MRHHPTSAKEAVVNNYYTAASVSTGSKEKQYLTSIVDKTLTNNGYSKSRQIFKPRNQQSKKQVPKLVTLILPITNENDANCIKNFVKAKKRPISPIFTTQKLWHKHFENQGCLITNSV